MFDHFRTLCMKGLKSIWQGPKYASVNQAIYTKENLYIYKK